MEILLAWTCPNLENADRENAGLARHAISLRAPREAMTEWLCNNSQEQSCLARLFWAVDPGGGVLLQRNGPVEARHRLFGLAQIRGDTLLLFLQIAPDEQ